MNDFRWQFFSLTICSVVFAYINILKTTFNFNQHGYGNKEKLLINIVSLFTCKNNLILVKQIKNLLIVFNWFYLWCLVHLMWYADCDWWCPWQKYNFPPWALKVKWCTFLSPLFHLSNWDPLLSETSIAISSGILWFSLKFYI